jgi:DNA-directed RNA polymerase subunit H (RpoH/RPB5)
MTKIVLQTCRELLEQRGYTIEDEEAEDTILASRGNEKMRVFMVENPVNVKTVETLISLMNAQSLSKGIVVYFSRITPYAKNVIEASEDVSLELFSERELRVNITKHSYVCGHTLVEQSDPCMPYLKTVRAKLPRLLQTDPVCKFYNFQPKNIIRIIRKDGSIAYRTVVAC